MAVSFPMQIFKLAKHVCCTLTITGQGLDVVGNNEYQPYQLDGGCGNAVLIAEVKLICAPIE